VSGARPLVAGRSRARAGAEQAPGEGADVSGAGAGRGVGATGKESGEGNQIMFSLNSGNCR
jgi:hypothetical protein